MVKIVGKKDPGDVVVIKVVRKEEEKAFQVTLGHRSVTFDLFNRNMQMSGPVSKRKDNFPLILQHDLPLPKEAMGGPIFDLRGDCIGINIARVDRVTTFTLPAKIVFPVVEDFLKCSYFQIISEDTPILHENRFLIRDTMVQVYAC